MYREAALAFTVDENPARNSYSIRSGADRLAGAVSFDEETDDPKTYFPPQVLETRRTAVDVRSLFGHLPSPDSAGDFAAPGAVTPVRRSYR
jgi:hypothetical protein